MATFVNPRPQPVKLALSDGTERVVRSWGLVVLPEGIDVLHSEYLPDTQAAPMARGHLSMVPNGTERDEDARQAA